MSRFHRPALLFCLLSAAFLQSCGEARRPVSPEDQETAARYLSVLEKYAETVFANSLDRYGEETPLFLDGVNLETLEPVTWQYDHHEWVLANLANQQNLLRTLVGLTELTEEPKYKEAAVSAVQFGFENLVTPNGLMYWGGHTAYDARGDEWVGRRYHWLGKKRSPVHELKATYPYYDLMWEIDEEATRRFIRAFWECHMREWERLDFDRHGGVESPKRIDESVWEHDFAADSPVGYIGKGRTFVNAGSDLLFAGAMLYDLDGEKPALQWAERLAGQYAKTSDPKTGLRGYQFTRPAKDRAEEQFGDLFPEKVVDEAHLFEPNSLAAPLLTQIHLAERLGKKGDSFLKWAIADLEGIGRSAYDDSTGKLRRTLLDGTDLSATEMPRDGYFGPKGSISGQWPAADYFIVYAAAATLVDRTAHPELWEMARKIGKANRLGDIGSEEGEGRALNFETDLSNPEFIFGLLDLQEITGDRSFLDLGCVIADNLIKIRMSNGYFKQEGDYRFTRVSRPESMALLHLAGSLLNRRDDLPVFYDSSSYFACELKSSDPAYTFDHNVIYTQLRSDPASR